MKKQNTTIFVFDKKGNHILNKDGSAKLTPYGKAFFRILENKKIKAYD